MSLEAFIIQILPAEFIAHKMLLHYDLTWMYVELTSMSKIHNNPYNKMQINSILDS